VQEREKQRDRDREIETGTEKGGMRGGERRFLSTNLNGDGNIFLL
jgi:hypothetical protein